jgi:nucleotide-binding universal stress UspA family protein
MIKINHILCPTDLTREADEALRYAIALARTYEARLTVLTWAEDVAPVGTLSRFRMSEGLRITAEQSLYERHPLGDMSALDWQFVLSEEGRDPAESISLEAGERGVDLIVMRSRRRPVAAALLGSTAEAVIRSAPCSVLVTHPHEREWVGVSTGEIVISRLLVAHDFSEYAGAAFNYGLSLAQEYQAELHLLHVCAPPAGNGPEIAWSPPATEGAYHQAVRRLQKAVPSEAHLWCNVRTAVQWGKPYNELLSYARENQIDLICMGAHGSGTGVRTLLGSNVDRVLRRSPCPVLVARPLGVASTTDTI